MQKATWLSEEALQIAEKRREDKSKGKKGKIYPFECRVPKNSKERLKKKAFMFTCGRFMLIFGKTSTIV